MAEEKMETPIEIVETHPGADQNRLLLEWQTPEFVKHEKGRTWYMAAGIVTLCLVAYALFTGSATMAIVFIVLAGVYILAHNQEPKIVSVKVTQLGLFVGDVFYPYNMIQAYWLVYHPPMVQTLNLKLAGRAVAKVTIQLDRQNPVEVRTLLSKEVPEVEGQQETMTELLIRLFRL
jgi:uncharacterized membrane protein YobD (UPF0266 family)